MYILLEDAKKHLNLDSDYIDDDSYIISLIEVAEDAVAKSIDKNLKDCLKSGKLIPSVRHAILLLLGTWYNARENVTFGKPVEVPNTLQYLVSLNKHYHINP